MASKGVHFVWLAILLNISINAGQLIEGKIKPASYVSFPPNTFVQDPYTVSHSLGNCTSRDEIVESRTENVVICPYGELLLDDIIAANLEDNVVDEDIQHFYTWEKSSIPIKNAFITLQFPGEPITPTRVVVHCLELQDLNVREPRDIALFSSTTESIFPGKKIQNVDDNVNNITKNGITADNDEYNYIRFDLIIPEAEKVPLNYLRISLEFSGGMDWMFISEVEVYHMLELFTHSTTTMTTASTTETANTATTVVTSTAAIISRTTFTTATTTAQTTTFITSNTSSQLPTITASSGSGATAAQTTTFITSSTSSQLPTITASGGSGGGGGVGSDSNIGIIIGIIVAVVFIIFIIIGVVVVIVVWKRKRSGSAKPEGVYYSTVGEKELQTSLPSKPEIINTEISDEQNYVNAITNSTRKSVALQDIPAYSNPKEQVVLQDYPAYSSVANEQVRLQDSPAYTVIANKQVKIRDNPVYTGVANEQVKLQDNPAYGSTSKN